MVLLSAQRPLAVIALAFLLATGGPARVEAAGKGTHSRAKIVSFFTYTSPRQ
jgi:hypothetical protein